MSSPSFAKRQKERARADKQREKAEKKATRARERSQSPNAEPGVDPDLVGIVPGPQPRLDEDEATDD
jgi:hypothetical protein